MSQRFQCTVTVILFFVSQFAFAGNSDQGNFSVEDIEARHEQVLGHPPRIQPLNTDDHKDEINDMTKKIAASVAAVQTGEITDYFATMFKHPDLLKGQLAFSVQLLNGELPSRVREVAILRVAWLSRAPYEWGEHVRATDRQSLLNAEDTERVTQGANAEGWTSAERAVLLAVDEMFADAMISDKTWALLADEFNEKQLLELPLLVGIYQGVAYLQNSVRFPLTKGNEGLMAR